jgi:hypothetical protein
LEGRVLHIPHIAPRLCYHSKGFGVVKSISAGVGTEIDITLQTIGPGEFASSPAVSSSSVQFGDRERTRRVIAAIQHDGTMWAGETVWQGKTAMRISVSCWATTDADVEQSIAAALRITGSTT